MKQEVNLAFSLNERFLVGFSVVLASILKQTKFESPPNVYILYQKLMPHSIEQIHSVFGVSCNLDMISIEQNQLPGMPCPSHLSIEAYFRLLLPRLLPDHVETLLYLDSDLIITDSITPLFQVDLEGKLIGISPHWNSGVMLMNLIEWRKRDFGEKLIAFVRDKPDLCPMADNSAILALVKKEDAEIFDLRWNTSHEVNEGHKGIIHAVGALKPWHFDYKYKHHQELFFRILDTTDWRGWRPKAPSTFVVLFFYVIRYFRKLPVLRSIRKGPILSAFQKHISS